MPAEKPAERVHGLVDEAAAEAAEMPIDGQRASRLDKAIMGGPPQKTGRFEYNYGTDTWTWSDAVARMHGYESGRTAPTTELVLSHKHPDDLTKVRALLAQSSAPFSSRHRIITTSGEHRKVVVVGDAVRDENGRVVSTRGFYIDITDSFSTDLRQSIDAEMDVILAHRQVIDMAKGMLMAIYRIDAEAAFGVLRWRSQELNVKLFAIAEQLVANLPDILGINPSHTSPVDHYVMTLAAEDTEHSFGKGQAPHA